LLEAGNCVSDALSKIKREGQRGAIDDFGTYSSLASLRRYDIHCLKIDKFFIDAVGANDSGTEIAKTATAMAKKPNIEVVAEGVEASCNTTRSVVLAVTTSRAICTRNLWAAQQLTAMLERGERFGPSASA
jgi:sensor c-di-GMP phosphodiesterase-like protein